LKLNDNRSESRDLQVKMEGLEEAIANGEEAALVGLKELLERRKSLDLQKTKIASYFGVAILP